jgi:hypothetical protein|tara:strand:+ start:1818 stop:2003 length:186 start_codon:yes stop_codon:yes gene_type:complete
VEVGDLVKAASWPDTGVADVGLVTCVDPEEIGDNKEVEVTWMDGVRMNHSARYLEVISGSR